MELNLYKCSDGDNVINETLNNNNYATNVMGVNGYVSRRQNGTTGYLFKVSESFKLKPSVMLKAVKGAPFEYDFNLNGWIQDIVGIGASYRTGDAFIGMFELQMTPNIRIGYAYDYLISNLKNYSKGTHELMLRYEFLPAKSKRILSPRYYWYRLLIINIDLRVNQLKF